MAKRWAMALLGLGSGYALGLAGGLVLTPLLSSNRHDVAVEAAMTGAFFWGPLLAVLGLIVGLALGRPRPPSRAATSARKGKPSAAARARPHRPRAARDPGPGRP